MLCPLTGPGDFRDSQLSFNDDFSRLAVAAGDQIFVLDARSGEQLRVIPYKGGAMALSPDGAKVALGATGARDTDLITIWEVGYGLAHYALRAREDRSAAPRFDKEGRLWVSRAGGSVAWDVESFAPLPQAAPVAAPGPRRPPPLRIPEPVATAMETEHTTRVGIRVAVSTGDSGGACLRDARSGRHLAELVFLPQGWVAFTEDGHFKHGGDLQGLFWHASGLARFDLGQLEPHVSERLLVPVDRPLPEGEPREAPACSPRSAPLPPAADRRSTAALPGAAVWSRRFRSPEDQACLRLAARATGDISVHLSFREIIDFGANVGALSAGGSGGESHLAVLDPGGAVISARPALFDKLLIEDDEGVVIGAQRFLHASEFEGRSMIGSPAAISPA